MAREPRRIRTVTVRLRSAVPAWARDRVARRLLVVAGIVVAGWLLGGAGPAHAGTSAGPASGTPDTALGITAPRIKALGITAQGITAQGAVPDVPAVREVTAVPDMITVPDLITVPDTATAVTTGTSSVAYRTTSPKTADTSVPGASSLRNVSVGLADSLREAEGALPVHLPAVLDLPGMARSSDTDLASAGPWPGGAGVDPSWTPRQRHGADAGSGDRAGVRAPEPFAVSGASKGGRWTFGAALSHPAPVPGAEHPQPFTSPTPAHVLRPAAGPVLTGVGLAHLGGPAAVARPSRLSAPPPFPIGPAAHSATNEPACSPD